MATVNKHIYCKLYSVHIQRQREDPGLQSASRRLKLEDRSYWYGTVLPFQQHCTGTYGIYEVPTYSGDNPFECGLSSATILYTVEAESIE